MNDPNYLETVSGITKMMSEVNFKSSGEGTESKNEIFDDDNFGFEVYD